MFTDINDSRDDSRTREQEDEVRDILRRRQRNTNYPTGGLVAAALGGLGLLVWGCVFASAWHDADKPLTNGHASFLAFSVVLGIAAVVVAVLWASVFNQRRLAAEDDRIMAYVNRQMVEHDERQARKIVDLVLAGLRDEERKRYIKAVADELREETDSTGCGRIDDRASVILLDRPRRGQRSS